MSTVGHSVDERWIHVVGSDAWGCMPYLTCPRCRLTIRIRAPYLTLRNCPRCLGRAGLPTPMYVSSAPRMGRSGLLAPGADEDGARLPTR